MKKLFFAPFIFAIFSFSVASAQIEVEKVPKSGDNKKVKVFTDDDDYFDDGGRGSGGDNLIKVDPVLILVGEVPLFYERRINDFLSLEIGAGPTLAHELTIFSGDFFSVLDGSYELYPEGATTELGLTYSLSARLYPLADGDAEGVYLGPTYHYKDFRFLYPLIDQNGFPTEDGSRLKWKYNDYLVQGGYQYEFWDNLYVDTYLGFGLRNKTLDVIQMTYDDDGNRQYNIGTVKKKSIAYSFGTKLGIRF